MPLWHWVHSSFYACFAIKCDEVPYQPSKSTTCDLQPQGTSPPFTGFKTFRLKDLSSARMLWITINRASAHQCLTSSRRALVNCCAVYPDEAKHTKSSAFPSCSLVKNSWNGTTKKLFVKQIWAFLYHQPRRKVFCFFISMHSRDTRCTSCRIAAHLLTS